MHRISVTPHTCPATPKEKEGWISVTAFLKEISKNSTQNGSD